MFKNIELFGKQLEPKQAMSMGWKYVLCDSEMEISCKKENVTMLSSIN
jgi:hypothetical protein